MAWVNVSFSDSKALEVVSCQSKSQMDLHQELNSVSFLFMFILSVRTKEQGEVTFRAVSKVECSRKSTGKSE